MVARPAKRDGVQLSQSISGGRKLRVCVVVVTDADARGSPLGPISDSNCKSSAGRGKVATRAPRVKTGVGGTSVDVDVGTGTTESTVVGTPRGRTGTAVTACARKRETKRMRAAGDMRAMVFCVCVCDFEGDMGFMMKRSREAERTHFIPHTSPHSWEDYGCRYSFRSSA